jgi:hypothetical protein
MSRAVHRLQSMLFFSIINKEDVLLIFEIMSTHLPKLSIVHVRGDNFTITSDFVFRPH